MKFHVISSLEKIRSSADLSAAESLETTVFGGERFSCQITVEQQEVPARVTVSAESPLCEHLKLYMVKDVVMDFPAYAQRSDDDYITKEPGLMPDLLLPMEETENFVQLGAQLQTFWVEAAVPTDTKAGVYPIIIRFQGALADEAATPFEEEVRLELRVLEATLEKPDLLVTQWFHVDCIASAHHVEVYSEEHWKLIDSYMKTAAELGINLILTPVLTPPLDTRVGTERPCVQLVKIEKRGKEYLFDFSLLARWLEMAQKNGIDRFEISHLFSQWGAEFAPNIHVTEHGRDTLMFGWHTPATGTEYKDFLRQFLPRLLAFLRDEGVLKNCRFHISDEPNQEHLVSYTAACNLVKPLLEGCVIMDALSRYEFYESGLVEHPVCATNHIEPFLEAKVPGLWAYYCCSQNVDVGNRFFAMPSYRNRILGLQMYKYQIEGFLQWAFNFYYSQLSRYEINPYLTSSADYGFPSGDAYTVYPGAHGALKSLRGLVFYEALQDIAVCKLLEAKIGREAVVDMIDRAAGMNLTFSEYPRSSGFILKLMHEMKERIANE